MEGICCVYHGAQLVECLLMAPCVRSHPCFPYLFCRLPEGVSVGPLIIVHVTPPKHVFIALVTVQAAVTQLDVYIHIRRTAL